MTRMSAFWTAIPMFLTGAGEILVNPVVYQYVFEQAPAPLRSLVQAPDYGDVIGRFCEIFTRMSSKEESGLVLGEIGSSLSFLSQPLQLHLMYGLYEEGSISNAITAALSPLVPENLNDGHLVYFYYINCIGPPQMAWGEMLDVPSDGHAVAARDVARLRSLSTTSCRFLQSTLEDADLALACKRLKTIVADMAAAEGHRRQSVHGSTAGSSFDSIRSEVARREHHLSPRRV
eukprot:s3637_g2.t1